MRYTNLDKERQLRGSDGEIFMKKRQPNVLKVLSQTAAKQAALSLADVKEALRIGSQERQQAEARVPHATASSRNRFR